MAERFGWGVRVTTDTGERKSVRVGGYAIGAEVGSEISATHFEGDFSSSPVALATSH